MINHLRESNPIRIAFVIDKMNVGGAERQLIELIRGMDKYSFKITVIVFYHGGDLWPELNMIKGIQVSTLKKKGRWDIFRVFGGLFKTLRDIKPHIIHSYLGGTNELCLFAGRLLKIKVVWGIRLSNIDFSDFDWVTRMSFRLNARLSRYVDMVIVNSEAGRKYHNANGYSEKNMRVIPNGIDTKRFCPDPQAGMRVRSEWGINKKSFLIGLVGRIHPMKGHQTFLKAAALLMKQRDNVYFVCVGSGSEAYKRRLKELEEDLNLSKNLIWGDQREDTPAVYNALNILSSSSHYGEGFSNVIAEAMACGVPCVVSKVGDSGNIIGGLGAVIPSKNPQALVDGWKKIVNLSKNERIKLKQGVRDRIHQNYRSELLIKRTEMLLLKLVNHNSSQEPLSN